jgi:hypothetical protein
MRVARPHFSSDRDFKNRHVNVREGETMKRRPKEFVSELKLSLEETAKLFNCEPRTIYRWLDAGMPQDADGLFSYPLVGLWWRVYRHQMSDQCHRHQDEDGLFLLVQALKMFPEATTNIHLAQQTLWRLSGFRLSSETIETIRFK